MIRELIRVGNSFGAQLVQTNEGPKFSYTTLESTKEVLSSPFIFCFILVYLPLASSALSLIPVYIFSFFLFSISSATNLQLYLWPRLWHK